MLVAKLPTNYSLRRLTSQTLLLASVATAVVLFSNAVIIQNSSSTLFRASVVLLIAVSGLTISESRVVVRFPWIPVALLVMTLVSIQKMGTSAPYDAWLAMSLLLAAALVLGMSDIGQLTLWGISLGATALAVWTIVDAVVLDPSTGFVLGRNALLGPFHNENIVGLSIVAGIASTLALKTVRFTQVLIKLTVILALELTIVWSQGRAALITSLLVINVWVLYVVLRNRGVKIFLWVLGVQLTLVASTIVWITLFSPDLLGLSGREPIWKAAVAGIFYHPVTGFGWSETIAPNSSAALWISNQTNWGWYAHVHNDILQWGFTSGLISGLLVAFWLIYLLYRAAKKLTVTESSTYLWIVLTTLLFITQGITEIATFRPQGWFIFCLMTVIIYRNESDQIKYQPQTDSWRY